MTLRTTGFNLLNGSEVCCSDVRKGVLFKVKTQQVLKKIKERKRESEIAVQSTKEQCVYSELKDFGIPRRHCVALGRENSSTKCTFIILKPCEK